MDEAPLRSAPQSTVPATLSWVAVCFIATTAVSLATAHAPPRVRLIGLFSIALGLLIGWAVVFLAEMLEFLPSASFAGTVAAVLTFCGLVGSLWETWRLDEAKQGPAAKDRFAEQLIEQLRGPSETGGHVSVESSRITSFRWYLSHRLRQLGHWTSPWPELFWGLELTLAAAAGYVAAFRLESNRLSASKPAPPISGPETT